MRSKPAFVVAAAIAGALLSADAALAQKSGRHAARLSSRQPAERVDPRGGDDLHGDAVHEHLQQSRALRPDQEDQRPRDYRARPRRELGLGRDQDPPHLQAAPGRQVARRQAVHRQGRAMHLEHADRQGRGRGFPQEPAPGLVAEPQGSGGQRRLRGDLRAHPPAARRPRHAGLGLHARLPLPRLHQGHAHQPDRHRPLQVRRIQARRVDQVRAQSRLLEKGPALSRRHRVARDREPLDARSWPSSPASSI